MIDGLLNALLLFLANWRPSILSYGYGVLGVSLYILCLKRSLITSILYRTILIYSLLILGCKLLILIIYLINPSLSFFDNKSTFTLFGIHVGRSLDSDMVYNFYSELVGILIGVLGIIYRNRLRKNNENLISRSFMGIAVILTLIATSVSYYSFINTIYFAYLIIWISFWGYRVNERFLQMAMIIISMTILVQTMVSPLCKMFLNNGESIQIKVGVLIFNDKTAVCYFCTFVLYFTTVSYVRRLILRGFKLKTPDLDKLDEELIRHNTAVPRFTTFFTQVMNYLSFTFIYGICMFNMFLWIANFKGYLQLLMALWMFYSIIEPKNDRMMFITRKLFIPLILMDCCILYGYNLLDLHLGFYLANYLKKFSQLYIVFEIWTISMFLLLQRRFKKSSIDTSKGSINMNIIIGVFLENSNKVALIVVFIIGLSKINVFHLGFMIIFLVFMLNSDISKRYWIVLVIYTQFMILTDYVFGIIILSGVSMDQSRILTIFGLSSKEISLVAVVFPQNYLTWILLLSAAMQLSAYRSSYIIRNRRETVQNSRSSKIIIFFSKIYAWISFLHVWIVYFAIFFAIMMSSLNVINFGRLLILVILYSMHVFNTMQPLKENAKKVEKNWNFIVYYSGLVLVVRYLYQFLRYAKQYVFTSDFLGIKIYSDEKLYENMVTDCVILLVCVYQKARMNSASIKSSDYFSVTDMIREKGMVDTAQNVWIKKIGISYFCYLYILFIFLISIFWRISASMLIYVLAILVYFIYIEKHIFSRLVKDLNKDPELLMRYRINIWKFLMTCSITYILLSFCSFCIVSEIFGDNYSKAEWAYFIMGFSIVGDGFLLGSNYQYLLIFFMLTVERHFIDDYIQNGIKLNALNKPRFGLVIKILMECFMPTFVLALSFSKLTVISVLYSLVVCFTIRIKPLIRTRVLFILLILSSLLQYTSLLVNLSKYDSPYEVPSTAESPPWQQVYSNKDNDVLTFLNLGTNKKQVEGLIGDLLVLWILSIFFPIFSMVQSELEKQAELIHSETSKRRKQYKEIFYSSIHFAILFIVLIFISESSGFFSLFYCIFCLICIYLANRILRNMNTFKKYLNLLQYFLIPVMSSELLFQTLFQIPFHGYLDTYDEEWFNAFDLNRLWSAGTSEPKNIHDKFRRVYFKIFTLGFILLAYWLMNTADYIKFVENLSKVYKVKARKLAIQIAYHFNNQRVKELKNHKEERNRSERDLEILDKNVQQWNLKFNERSTINFGVNIKRGDQIADTMTSDHLKIKYKPGLKRIFQNYLIGSINPVIFKHFLCRIKQKKNDAILKEDLERAKSVVEITSFIDSPDLKEMTELEAKLKKKNHVYILTVKDYLKLILYLFCSSTQGIVFFFFFLNHFYYASLESLVFPISVLCYGLLAYPRPNPKFFKLMLIYTEFVFLSKFLINLYVWDFLNTDYNDTAKLGFNFAYRTYSKTLTTYVIFDAICMLALLAHEYYLIRCGMHEHAEDEIESLQQARARRKVTKARRSLTISMVGKTEKRPKVPFNDRIKQFFGNIHGKTNQEKPGFDYYTRTVLVQFLILLFILFFFPQMDGETESVISIFEANTFPGNLVIALMFHVLIMFLERYIYIEVTSKERNKENSFKSLKFKFYFHLILVFCLHILIFWYFPLNANSQKNPNLYCREPYNTANCNNFEINGALKAFYLFYLLYFVISALQIKYGSPNTRAGEFVLMKNQNQPANIVFLIYRGIPFLYEIRTLMDWTFTSTSLKIMQWFKFEEIYSNLYNTKCDQLELAEKPRAQSIGKFEKCLKGCSFLLVIILCILAPLIIFSSLNPIVYDNPIKDMSMSLGIKSGSMNFYSLMMISKVTDKSSVSENEWNDVGFNKAAQLTASDRSLTERFTLNNYSDTIWTISKDVSDDLCRSLRKKDNLKFQVNYVFTRDYPKSQQTVTNKETSDMSDKEADIFYKMTCLNSNETFIKKNAFLRVVRLLSTGANLLPIIIDNSDLKTDISVRFLNTSNQRVWEFGRNIKDGMQIYVISEKYSPVTFNFSVITFYISVVYLVGKILRVIISGGANNIPLVDMPNPDALINICSGIYISRMNGDLEKEEILYYELIDILRSPELMKMIGGSSSIKKKEE